MNHPQPLSITIYPREEDVVAGHDVALEAWLSQDDGKTLEEAAKALTDELMNIGLRSGTEQAAAIFGASKLLMQFAGVPQTKEA